MNVSYYVDLRAFGGKVASPSTCCLEEVLNDRARLLRAREAGVLNFQEERQAGDGERHGWSDTQARGGVVKVEPSRSCGGFSLISRGSFISIHLSRKE